MKKTTIISTLAMVLIVALALTTATFAWYSSNNTVTASGTLTAAVAGDSNLAIDAVTNPTKSSLVLTDAGTYTPVAPSAALTSASTISNFWKATVNGNGEFTAINDVGTADLMIQPIFVRNNAPQMQSGVVSVSVGITGTLNAKVDYALFGVSGNAGADGNASISGKVYARSYGYAARPADSVVATPTLANTVTLTPATETIETNIGKINAGANVQFVLFVWLDQTTVNGDGGGTFSVAVTFTAA